MASICKWYPEFWMEQEKWYETNVSIIERKKAGREERNSFCSPQCEDPRLPILDEGTTIAVMAILIEFDAPNSLPFFTQTSRTTYFSQLAKLSRIKTPNWLLQVDAQFFGSTQKSSVVYNLQFKLHTPNLFFFPWLNPIHSAWSSIQRKHFQFSSRTVGTSLNFSSVVFTEFHNLKLKLVPVNPSFSPKSSQICSKLIPKCHSQPFIP